MRPSVLRASARSSRTSQTLRDWPLKKNSEESLSDRGTKGSVATEDLDQAAMLSENTAWWSSWDAWSACRTSQALTKTTKTTPCAPCLCVGDVSACLPALAAKHCSVRSVLARWQERPSPKAFARLRTGLENRSGCASASVSIY